MQSKREGIWEREKDSLATGDNLRLRISQIVYNSVQFWSGVNLNVMSETISNSSLFIKERKHNHALLQLLGIQNAVRTLTGKNGSSVDDEMLTKFEQQGDPRELAFARLHKIYLCLIFNDAVTLKGHGNKYFASKKDSWLMMHTDSIAAFLLGLSA